MVGRPEALGQKPGHHTGAVERRNGQHIERCQEQVHLNAELQDPVAGGLGLQQVVVVHRELPYEEEHDRN